MRLTSYLLKDPITQYFPKMGKSKTADTEYSKDQFIKALGRFNEILKERNEKLTFLCVGGGAMMLAYNARQSTHDIDGLLQPHNAKTDELFMEITRQVAKEMNIEDEWINIQVKDIMKAQGYKPANFESNSKYHWSNLKMLFAKPGYLLGMKCQSLRVGRKDFRDVVTLIKMLNIKSIDQLEAEVSKYVDWNYVGNDEIPQLKLAIAWAHPGATEYEYIRTEALNRYKAVKQQPLAQAA